MDRKPGIMTGFCLAILASCASPVFPEATSAQSNASAHFTQHSTEAECLKAVGGNPLPCAGVDWRSGTVETAGIDADGDGDEDLIVRNLSPVTCGSKGCSTDIFLKSAAGLTIAEPRLVTAGPISTCGGNGARGLRAVAGASGPCFLFQPASQ